MPEILDGKLEVIVEGDSEQYQLFKHDFLKKDKEMYSAHKKLKNNSFEIVDEQQALTRNLTGIANYEVEYIAIIKALTINLKKIKVFINYPGSFQDITESRFPPRTFRVMWGQVVEL